MRADRRMAQAEIDSNEQGTAMDTITANGVQLAYEQLGEGPPVVCVHGGWTDRHADVIEHRAGDVVRRVRSTALSWPQRRWRIVRSLPWLGPAIGVPRAGS